jgi:hypothetical protein
MSNTSSSHWLDLSWPSLVICAAFGGCLLAMQVSPDTIKTLRETLTKHREVKAERARVLIVTNDAIHRQQILATLEPRGFEPLIAQSRSEAAAQLAQHPGALRAAVLDATVRDSAAIERELRNSLPPAHIVVLPRRIPSERIGALLVDRI